MGLIGASGHLRHRSLGSHSPLSYSLKFLKGLIYGNMLGSIIGLITGDTRILDYGSFRRR